jgi:predicted DNA-binding protein (MmcQ/YjbR family)
LNIESFRNYCLSRKGATEDFPFDNNTLVYKVMGKMFALADVQDFTSINLKVEPESGTELRERYPSVLEGYHMNKKHWITVLMDGAVPDRLICQWIDDSYHLVADGLTKSQKSALDSM